MSCGTLAGLRGGRESDEGMYRIHSQQRRIFLVCFRMFNRFQVLLPISPQELGQRVLQALDSYHENTPGKTYVRGVRQPLSPFLAFAGFRSWKAFEKGAQHFSISSDDSQVEITPSVSRPQGGYLHQPERAVRCRAHAGQIGGLLLEQLPRP